MIPIVGIYKITSPSGKVYIGQSWNIMHRWADYGKKTAKSQRALCFSFNKHGKKAHAFSIIHQLPADTNQLILDQYEQFYMDGYRTAGIHLLNCREGGSKGKLSEESRKRMSESLKGRIPWNRGMKGVVKMSDETKLKMSISSKKHGSPWNYGRKMPEHLREKLKSINIGAKRSKEVCEKISIATMGRKYHGKNNGKVRSLEVRQLHSRIQTARTDNKGSYHHMAKLTDMQVLEIRQKFKPRIYPSRKLAAEYNISKTVILDIINRKIWRHI